MSDFTLEKLRAVMRDVERMSPPRQPSIFDSFYRPFAGMQVFEAPPPAPKIQVQDIRFSDGTSILAPEFRAKMNAWLIERFGHQDDLFKHHAYILGNYGMVVSRDNAAVLRTMSIV